MKKGVKMDGKSAIRGGGGVLTPNGKCHAKNPFLWIPSLLEPLILINSRSQEKHETKFSGGRKNCENNLVFTRLHGEITKMELTLSMKY